MLAFSRSFAPPWNRSLFCFGLALYLICPWINPGFVALDDYTSLTEFFIPAQQASVTQIIANSEIRSPVPRLLLFGASKTLLHLGIQDPFLQYQGVLTALALIAFLCFAFAVTRLYSADKPEFRWALFLIGFFYLCPFFFSRAMIESLSAPFLTLSATFAVLYKREEKLLPLFLSLLFLSIAATMRFQTGICAIVLILLTFKRPRHLVALTGMGVLLFLCTGGLDLLLRGSFHHSLVSYVRYNLHHSSSYGTTPFYTYLLLWIGLLLPPTFIARYRGFDFKKRYHDLGPLVWYAGVFILSHSLIPHKEERFMVPIVPVVLLSLAPLATHLFSVSPARRYYFLGLNGFLLLTTLISTPQKNALGVIRYLNAHSELTLLYDFDQSVVPYLSAFLKHPVDHVPINPESTAWDPADCHSALAVRWDWRARVAGLDQTHVQVATFDPAWPEAVFVRLNPLRNARRGPILLFRPKNCPD